MPESIHEIDQEIHAINRKADTQAGWFKAVGSFVGVAVIVIGSLCGVIMGKLSAIESLLTTQQVVQGRLEERYISLDKRVTDIERIHRPNGQE